MVSRPRFAAAAGALGIVLIFLALFLPGPAPKTSDSTHHLVHELVDKRRVFLVGMYLAGLGELAVLWFLGALRSFLADLDDGLATTAVAGGVVGSALIIVGMAVVSGPAVAAARQGDTALVRAAVDTGNIVIELGKFGLGAMVLATALAARRARRLPEIMSRVGFAAGALAVASALSPFLADRGAWQFGGVPDLAGGLAITAWLIWLSLRMASRRPAHV